jgi:hypothetical protein
MIRQRLKHLENSLARRALKKSERWAQSYWHDFPFGRAPRATREDYLSLWKTEKGNAYPSIDEFERAAGFAVDQAWMNDLALHTQVVIKTSPLCFQHGRVVYTALRGYLAGRDNKATPVTIFETGTARGFSAIIMARALEEAGAGGKIMTFDILPHNRKMYWNCVDDLDGPKSRAELLAPWGALSDGYVAYIEGDSRINLGKVACGHIGFAFLDGAHGHEDVLFEFETVASAQRAGDVIVFDDYNERDFPGLVQAVDEGCVRFGYDKEVVSAGRERRYVIARRG